MVDLQHNPREQRNRKGGDFYHMTITIGNRNINDLREEK